MFEVSRYGEIYFEISKRIAKYKGTGASHLSYCSTQFFWVDRISGNSVNYDYDKKKFCESFG